MDETWKRKFGTINVLNNFSRVLRRISIFVLNDIKKKSRFGLILNIMKILGSQPCEASTRYWTHQSLELWYNSWLGRPTGIFTSYSFILYSFFHSFIHLTVELAIFTSYSFYNVFIHSFIHPFIHSFIHSPKSWVIFSSYSFFVHSSYHWFIS